MCCATISEEKNSLRNFDFLFIKRFAKLVPLFLGNRWSIIIFVFLIIVALVEQYIVYNIGIITSEYYKILGEKNLNGFWAHSIRSVAIIICISLIISTKQYLSSVLYAIWRQLLTGHLQKQYMHSNNYYKVNVLDKPIDNPDQRISQDIDKMCNKLSSNMAIVIVSPFTISYYSYVSFVTTGWWGPMSVFGFFLISTVINKLLMSPVVNYVFLQERCEGFFRYKHMHIRTNAESIAFQDGSFNELTQLNKKFADLIKVQQNLFVWQFPLNVFVNLFAYLGSIFSFFLLAYPLFNGKYDSLPVADLSALISKNTFVTMYLINCFTQLVNLSSDVTVIAGTTHRISELFEWIKISNTFEHAKRKDLSNIETEYIADNETLIEINNAMLCTPGENHLLISQFSYSFKKSNNVLINGDSGCGKTSFLRVLKELWPISEGQIKWKIPVVTSYIFYLPQKPLLTDGTLRQQIIYPLDCSLMITNIDEIIIRYLKVADLLHILQRTGGLDESVDWNWCDVLSPGEMQRLSFVRLFYHKPILAFLDEATSAVTQEMEETLFNFCKFLDITLCTIGHRKSLISHHTSIITFTGKGTYKLSSV